MGWGHAGTLLAYLVDGNVVVLQTKSESDIIGKGFLAYLSWKLKLAFPIAYCPSSVSPYIHVSINLHIFIFFSKTTGQISTKFGTKHPRVKEIQVCSNKRPCHLPMGDNIEQLKIHWRNMKIFFWTTRPISTKLTKEHPWVKKIRVCSNEVHRPLPMGR